MSSPLKFRHRNKGAACGWICRSGLVGSRVWVSNKLNWPPVGILPSRLLLERSSVKLELASSKSLDKFKSLYGPTSGTTKASSFSSRPSTDSISLGSFANLKLTAEKLVKEQASVKIED
ncbi:hypothetical protein K1719_019273 [Acacia pycnantha]|nr:hypothetical protein K1719_019273 [Acacia pycnantha]